MKFACAAGASSPSGRSPGLPGSTAGGSCLKRLGINLGLRMEIEVERRRIVTSPVCSISVLERALSA